jgi:hypothetical protein
MVFSKWQIICLLMANCLKRKQCIIANSFFSPKVYCKCWYVFLKIDEFSLKLNDVEKKLEQKTNEVDVLQAELKAVREFRHKRSQMQQELDQVNNLVIFV